MQTNDNTAKVAFPAFPNGLQKVYQETIIFAAQRHEGQRLLRDGVPYLVHLCNVCMEIFFAASYTPGFNLLLAMRAALLHDVLEDTQTTQMELVEKFGDATAAGVKALTKDAALPKELQMVDSLRRIKEQPVEIWAVKLADRITNLQEPPSVWSAEKISRYKDEAIFIYETLCAGNAFLAERLKTEIKKYNTTTIP
ncbi:MAG: HD domain-containing protein [Puniceicoccales bacterium]|jgi:guanosine-3',5'-bis(diphosphate) 3'-pyrophosphohydrolase|nr:HD domain-containing protein [Puniceicoccales bacterium]